MTAHSRDWIKQYETNGLDELLTDNFTGGKQQLSEAQLALLQVELRTTVSVTAADICRYEPQSGVSYTPEGLVKLLHSIGFSYKKTKRIPGKADADKQEVFPRRSLSSHQSSHAT